MEFTLSTKTSFYCQGVSSNYSVTVRFKSLSPLLRTFIFSTTGCYLIQHETGLLITPHSLLISHNSTCFVPLILHHFGNTCSFLLTIEPHLPTNQNQELRNNEHFCSSLPAVFSSGILQKQYIIMCPPYTFFFLYFFFSGF